MHPKARAADDMVKNPGCYTTRFVPGGHKTTDQGYRCHLQAAWPGSCGRPDHPPPRSPPRHMSRPCRCRPAGVAMDSGEAALGVTRRSGAPEYSNQWIGCCQPPRWPPSSLMGRTHSGAVEEFRQKGGQWQDDLTGEPSSRKAQAPGRRQVRSKPSWSTKSCGHDRHSGSRTREQTVGAAGSDGSKTSDPKTARAAAARQDSEAGSDSTSVKVGGPA